MTEYTPAPPPPNYNAEEWESIQSGFIDAIKVANKEMIVEANPQQYPHDVYHCKDCNKLHAVPHGTPIETCDCGADHTRIDGPNTNAMTKEDNRIVFDKNMKNPGHWEEQAVRQRDPETDGQYAGGKYWRSIVDTKDGKPNPAADLNAEDFKKAYMGSPHQHDPNYHPLANEAQALNYVRLSDPQHGEPVKAEPLTNSILGSGTA